MPDGERWAPAEPLPSVLDVARAVDTDHQAGHRCPNCRPDGWCDIWHWAAEAAAGLPHPHQ